LAEELWERLGGDGFAIQQPWPTYDAAYLQTQTVTVVVQVNGKVRGELRVSTDASKEEILKSAKEVENVRKYLTGTVRKEVYVPGKLVNLVVEPS
jgi:leucyl-tRNA synthetase